MGPLTAEWFFQSGPDSVNIGWARMRLSSAAEWRCSWQVRRGLGKMAYLSSMQCLFLQQANLSSTRWWQQPRSQEQQEEKPQHTGISSQIRTRGYANSGVGEH